MKAIKEVFVCSPLRATTKEDYQANIIRARQYCELVTRMGHMPFAPHLFYTQFLDEFNEEHRILGIQMGIRRLSQCDELWYWDEPTRGMREEIKFANEAGKPVIHWTGHIDLCSIESLPEFVA